MKSHIDDLISGLNKKLKPDHRMPIETVEPGLVFFAAYYMDTVREACPVLVLKPLENKNWLCCKISVDLSSAGPFDMPCGPDEWTGTYSILVESWNTFNLHEKRIIGAKADRVPDELMETIMVLHNAYTGGTDVPRHISNLCGFKLGDELDDRHDFQKREANIADRIRKNPSHAAPNPLIRSGNRVSICNTFSVDKRAGFEIPFTMAGLSGGRIVPVQDISPSSGKWDLIQTKEGDPRLNCIVGADRITQSMVEKAEIQQIKWFEINKRVFTALARQEDGEKIRHLERILADTGNDPYAAFNLAWVLLFKGERKQALEYLALAEKKFPAPEYRNLAAKAGEFILADAGRVPPPFIEIWRLRCRISDPYKRLAGLKKIWLASGEGYVAYEIAEEYRYTGALDADRLNYDFYNKIRYWASMALSSPRPIDTEMREWPKFMLNLISEPVPAVSEADKPYFYIPLEKAA